MKNLNIPGFTAEAAFLIANGRHQMCSKYEGSGVAEQILPQLEATSCGHDPTNICRYVCCTITSDPSDPYDVPTVRCSVDWICGHRAPGAGVVISDPLIIQ